MTETPTLARRDVLKLGAVGATALGLGTTGLPDEAAAATIAFDLTIVDLAMDLVDGTVVNALAFAGPPTGARVPGPVLRVKEGQDVTITVANTRRESHGFEITGVPGSRTEIAAGGKRTIAFRAPVAGTYIYHDNLGGALYRLLGLHGVLVVEPANGRTASGAQTPYSIETYAPEDRQRVSALFDALGYTKRFMGGASGRWVPNTSGTEYSNQEKIWVVSQIDPRFNALLVPGQPIRSDASLTRDVVAAFVPRYFLINGRSGFDLAEGDDVVPRNYIGEPTLLRTVNVGLCTHSLHIHGNHIMELSESDFEGKSGPVESVKICKCILERDTWQMRAMQRKDVLLPFEIPPDIPGAELGNVEANQFYRATLGKTQERLPLKYVMHCHTEMSNTAAGGNYPQGMVTHWEIVGGVGGRGKTSAL